jgi:TPR repeat protein
MTRSNRPITVPLLVGVAVLSACSPYYGGLADHLQRQLNRAVAAKAAGDTAGACATLARAAAGDSHPTLLILHGRCLMDAKDGTRDLAAARTAFERAYAMHSRLKGRAALWLGILERKSGGGPAAQIAWLERARELGEPGTERLLLKAWADDPQTYRAQLIAAHERAARTDPYSALELARLLAGDPTANPATRQARTDAAVHALSASARAGNSKHARALAWLYRTGDLVPENPAKAKLWLTAAARGGDGKSMVKMAEQAWADGDLAAAQGWLEQAVAAGDQQAAVNLSRGYLTGKLQPADHAAAAELIARTVATQASPDLQLAYAQALLNGVVVPPDPELGRVVLERAAAARHVPSQTKLGRRYLRGLDVPADAPRGQALLEASAEAGDAAAMFHLASAYLKGQGVAEDARQGIDWLERAAQAGSRGAKLELGRRHLRGLGVPVDVARGRAVLEALAAAGHAGAMLQLGKAYANGHGLPRNPARAREWLGQAAQAGNEEAEQILRG